MYKQIFLIGISLTILSGCLPKKSEPAVTSEIPEATLPTAPMDDMMNETRLNDTERVAAFNPQLEAYLQDVTAGEGSGIARAKFEDGMYSLEVDIYDVPLLDDESFFYEGWLVNDTPDSAISTGKVMMIDGALVNQFTSDQDYSDYTKYVVTLEPTNDGEDGQPDPAPATHVLEGEFMTVDI